MAGYRRAGAGQFTNATTINDQMDRQRAAYRSRNEARNAPAELGIGHDTSALFKADSDIFGSSVSTFAILDISSAAGAGENPDFQFGGDQRSSKSVEMFNDLNNAEDMPNQKGPNLAVPDINKLQSGAIVPGSEAPQGAENNRSRGFGWEDGRNVEGSGEATIGSYFSRHYNAQNTSQIKPIFGEAKSPLGDTNIDYNQPE